MYNVAIFTAKAAFLAMIQICQEQFDIHNT